MDFDAELADRLAIQSVLSSYCRGIDRLEGDRIADAYWPDAIDDHGIFAGTATDFVPFILRYMADAYSRTAHRLGQSYIEFSGDEAVAETYFASQHRLRDDEARIEAVDGRYVDRLQRRDGVWKIFRRLVVIDFLREHGDGASRLADIERLTVGRHGDDDPSYAIFANLRESRS
ncbi:nuclear transport factor 2 family protein [Sphingosinicella soli]|uniref:SnoaL-like domain-containing protein n=1 Tax=Sphingosinicella soli TaxID=333708 RepID=A0A7W7F634_9SPHN|nr:nuclear transport factor 2 family protein [Sphingosinicella soli]MBB4631971.1 hypothetical protein [Sphingosinicella soli]